MAITIYGIKSCDTMKKARAWLDQHGVPYRFHDYKAEGASKASLESWCREHGWEVILNRAGTTFRALPQADKQDLDAAKAVSLMQRHTSLIKRPVLDLGDRRLVGFKPEIYAAALKAAA